MNTFLYETGEISAKETLRSAERFGFRYVDLAAYKHADPTQMKKEEKADFVRQFRDGGFISSQLLVANTQNIASPDETKRRATMDYMKACGDFQLELGGRQLLICWGCGVNEASISRERSWVNTVDMLREYARWCKDRELLVGLELDPHIYFVVNSLDKMARVLEDVDMPNVYPNIDIGHLCITREPPKAMEKVRHGIIHVHISETDTFEHTNSIIGSGTADFRAYLDKAEELGIEENCERVGEVPVAGIEMGEPGHYVEDPDRWTEESLEYLKRTLPDLTLS